MIVVRLERGTSFTVERGAAVTHTSLPTAPGNTPAQARAVLSATGEMLAVVRVAEVAGYDLSRGGAAA